MTLAAKAPVDLSVDAAKARVHSLLGAWTCDDALLNATMALGFSRETARVGLEAELGAWRDTAAFEAIWASEAPHTQAERVPGAVLLVAARTLPASAMRQILWARALGADVLLKPASGQRTIGAALCREGLGCVLLNDAPEVREETIARGVAVADAVIALGNDETVAALRTQTPQHKAFIAYGHRISAAILDAGENERELAALARDCVAWAHSGCLAPRLVLVAGDPARLASRLAPHVAAAAAQLTPPPLDEAHARRIATTMAVMRGFTRHEAGGFTLCVEPSGSVAPTYPRRWLAVRPYSEADLIALAGSLSTLAVAPDAPRPPPLGDATRIAALGAMQAPDLTWRQDGLQPIASLLRPSAA